MPPTNPETPVPTAPAPEPAEVSSVPYLRAGVGGALMGLANLVPGISGGTMLLAVGVYTHFIEAVADFTRMRWRRASLLFLVTVAGAAVVAIALFAGPVKDLVVARRWMAYSAFVGLTLGGIPALLRLARPLSTATWIGAVAGFAAMGAVGVAQQSGASGSGILGDGAFALFIAGLAGAASMVLPGISGGYILLVLGQYVTILAGIDALIDALRAVDPRAAWAPLIGVVVPVGLGLVFGVALVSNLVRYLLRAHRAATLGVLLGLLGGVVVGLWPFQEGVPPQPGDVIKGHEVTQQSQHEIPADDWPVRVFSPAAAQVTTSIALVVAGALVTVGASRIRGR